MAAQTEAAKVPQLRFPEFNGEWEEKNIGDVLTIGSGRDYKHLNNGDIPVYGTGGYMTSVDNFLYNGESVCIGRKGTIDKPVLINGKFWTVDTLFYTHSFIDLLPKFLFPIFKRTNWKKYNEASGVPSLSKSTIEKIKINIPTKPEQQKIAAFLTAVDNKIEQLSKKQELLGEYKKGLMQQIFSQVTRFKADDGSEFPDWKEKRLGDIANITIGEFVIKTRQNPNAQYPVYNGGKSNTGFYDEFNNEGSKIIISARGANAGFVNFEAERYWAGNSCYSVSVREKNTYNINFYYYLIKHFEKRFTDYQQAANIPSVSKKDVSNFKIVCLSLNEQTKIANFLISVDNKIEQVGKQLDESKQFKKALLQQMFI